MEVMINERKMEIKKGKYYYNKESDKLFLAYQGMTGDDYVTDKIAVHIPEREDWDYVCEKLGYSKELWKGGAWIGYKDNSCIELNEQMHDDYEWYEQNNYHIITMQQFKALFEPQSNVLQLQKHYENTPKKFRSLFELQEVLGLNGYEFDILKRLVRCRKKGQFAEDLQKIKDTCDLYLQEQGVNNA